LSERAERFDLKPEQRLEHYTSHCLIAGLDPKPIVRRFNLSSVSRNWIQIQLVAQKFARHFIFCLTSLFAENSEPWDIWTHHRRGGQNWRRQHDLGDFDSIEN